MSQPLIDARLPPPLQHQYSAPQELSQPSGAAAHLEREISSHGYEAAAEASHGQSIPSIANMVHASGISSGSANILSSTVLPPVRQTSLSPLSQHSFVGSNVQSQKNSPPAFVRESTPLHQVSKPADDNGAAVAGAADATAISGQVSPLKRTPASFSDETPAPALAKTPEVAKTEAEPAQKSGSATPGDAPEATDIPHAKLAVGGPAGFAGEDLRAIRVLDRKFCI